MTANTPTNAAASPLIPKAERENVMAARAAATKLGARLRGLSPEALRAASPLIANTLGRDLVALLNMPISGATPDPSN